MWLSSRPLDYRSMGSIDFWSFIELATCSSPLYRNIPAIRYEWVVEKVIDRRLELISYQNADYPAVLPYEKSRELFLTSGHPEPSANERNVRGTLVIGLNDKDIALLDLFEGDVRTRRS